MRLIHFLTFVLFVSNCWAFPDSELSTTKIDTRPTSGQIDQGASLIQTRNNFSQSLNFHFGIMYGPLVDKQQNVTTQFFGITQTHYNHNFTAQEFGLELTQSGLVGVHLGWKDLLALGRMNEPYYKISLGGLYKPSEMLAGLVNSDRYQIRGAFGLEDFLSLNRSLRIEALAAYSPLGISCQISVAYALPD